MASIKKTVTATVILTLEEWAAIKVWAQYHGTLVESSSGYVPWFRAKLVVENVHRAMQDAGLC